MNLPPGAAPPLSTLRRVAAGGALTIAIIVVLIGCAKKEPPSGGPPDLDRPRVASSSPESAAARVPVDVRPAITFSEAMEPRSTGEAIALAPRVDIRQQRWSGRTVTLVLAESLRADQTYTLFVGGGARDRHGNPLGAGAAVVFTTGAALPAGVLEGEINARGFAAPGTYLWTYRDAPGRVPDSTARDFDALGLADDDGRFRVVGLPVPGRYRLWAFADLNRNRSFEPESDLLAPADTVLQLTEASPVRSGLSITVVNPRAPGKVRGTVLDSLDADGTGPIVLATSERDTLQRVTAETNRELQFVLELAPGPWSVRAFRDLDRNGSWQRAREPAGPPVRVEVSPAGEQAGLVLRVRSQDEGP